MVITYSTIARPSVDIHLTAAEADQLVALLGEALAFPADSVVYKMFNELSDIGYGVK